MHLKMFNYIFSFLLISHAVARTDNGDGFTVGRQELVYRTEELPDDKFLALSRLSDATQFRSVLDNIMIPRVVGTAGHKQVRNYIRSTLENLQWTVNVDKFHDTVPILGKLQFHNLYATLNPDAERYLVLACHYDSKYMPDYEFIGATDSAVPCAMLVNLAQVLHEQLLPLRDSKLSLMLLFFDGEEAFEEWGPHDSIYGARHLARKWHEAQFLDKIDMLVLLDLLGAPDPKFYSFFANTDSWYSRFIAIEERLASYGLLERYTSSGVIRAMPNRYFQPNALRSSFIEDDHIPFLRRNVPILHMIPVPFPSVWHTQHDNASVIDYVTTENISQILRMFVMEYMLSFKGQQERQ